MENLSVYDLINRSKRALIKGDYNNAIAYLEYTTTRIRALNRGKKDVTDILSRGYTKVGGLEWALQNEGTSTESPGGKLYTWDEAKALENEKWRLPNYAEWKAFRAQIYYAFDEERGMGLFIDKKTDARVEILAGGWYSEEDDEVYAVGALCNIWLSDEFDLDTAHFITLNSTELYVDSQRKAYRSTVRLVRR